MMKKLHWTILLLFFFKISYYQAQFGIAKVENQKIKYSNYNIKAVVQNASSDSMLVFQKDKKGKRDKSSAYYKKTVKSSYYLDNISTNANFPKVSIKKNYSNFKSDANETAYIPFFQDGLYVCNQKREIYTHNGDRWYTFTDIENLIFDAQIDYPNAISYKRYPSELRKLWVSSFYDSRALVAVYGDNYSVKSDWYFLGHIDKNKKFTPFDKPKKFKLNPVGITPEGYVVFLEYEKADVYDADLKSVSNSTFLAHLQAASKIKDKTKGKIPLIDQTLHPKPKSIVNQVKKEGYVLVTKYHKSAAKKGKHLINYSNLKGELLFKKWIVTDKKCEPEFRNGVISVESDGKWVEFNNKGKSTFNYPEGVTFASHFVNGKSLIETKSGIALINREGKVLTNYFPNYTFSISDWNKSGFVINNGLVVIQEKEGLNSVILDENLNELELDAPKTKMYYFNDSLISIYKAIKKEEYKPRDFTKEFPEVNSYVASLKSFNISIRSGFLPSDNKTGYIKPGTEENFFIQNNESIEHEVEVTFYYETSAAKYWKTFTVVVPPNQIRIIDPSSEPGLKLRTFSNQYKSRNFKLAFKVDGKPQEKE